MHLELGHWLEVQMHNLYKEYQQKRYLNKRTQEIMLRHIFLYIFYRRSTKDKY